MCPDPPPSSNLFTISVFQGVEAQNQARLADARVLHRARLDQLQEDNSIRLQEAQEEHQAMCVRLAAEHEDAKAVAQHEFEELRVLLTRHNDALMEEARAKYQEALALAQVGGGGGPLDGTSKTDGRSQEKKNAEYMHPDSTSFSQADYEEMCIRIREDHSYELERVKQHNIEIWPQV